MYLQGAPWKFLRILISLTLTYLQTCARVLLDERGRRLFLKRFRRPNLENMQRQAFSKAVNTAARKVVYCPYCAAVNGTVKKAGPLRIIHDKFRAKKTAEDMEKYKKTFSSAVEAQKDLGQFIGKALQEDLNPLKVHDLFRRVSDEVCFTFQSRLHGCMLNVV